MYKHNQKPKCKNHPEKNARCIGLCESCYHKKRNAERTPQQIQRDKIRSQRWLSKNRKKRLLQQRSYNLKKKYGISQQERDILYKKQKGVCAICKVYKTKLLYVDHNHKTGKVRGLLCSNCNFGIGYFKENVEFLENAIKYLKEHNTEK